MCLMFDKIELFIILGYSLSYNFILALWICGYVDDVHMFLSVFKYNLLAFNHVESLYNS